MLGSFKPVVLEPSGGRRSRRGPPGWLVGALLGTAAGAGGLLFLQSRDDDTRLSADESNRLRAASEAAESERKRLKDELDSATRRLEASVAEKKSHSDELAKAREGVDKLREELAALMTALPPDTRGGPIEVRAGRFTVEAGKLAYSLVLSRRKPEGAAFNGVVQLVVTGTSGAGGSTTFISNPLPLSVDRHQTLRGNVPLPDGFAPKQTTVKVLDRVDGKQQGLRVLYVD